MPGIIHEEDLALGRGLNVNKPNSQQSNHKQAPGFAVSKTIPNGLAEETPGPNMFHQGKKPMEQKLQDASGMKGPLPVQGTMNAHKFRTYSQT